MIKRYSLMTFWLAAALMAASPLRAGGNANVLPESFKASINRMVQSVKRADSPDLKRKILDHYLTRMDRGLGMVKTLLPLKASDERAVNALSGKFRADLAELNGSQGYVKVADADLDHFAGFVQQDVEQAGISGGGFYISTGVILVIILLILLFR